MSRRRFSKDRRQNDKDRRWFYPPRIENRGKTSLPFTTREPDFEPNKFTVRRATDKSKRGSR